MAEPKGRLRINGIDLKVSNLNKPFYPETDFTKGQVIDYYIRIAPALLPHLTGRPITLKRYPEGASSDFFYQKECPVHRPDWLPTVPVWSEKNGKDTNYCLIEDLPSLVWASNIAALELHTSLSYGSNMAQPSMAVFDLDPGSPADIIDCAKVALLLWTFFDRCGLKSFVKTSGSKGLQVYLPLNTPVDYQETKGFARALAQHLEKQYPDFVVSNMKKALRKGKVFIDWSQNDEHKTTVCVYSLRARPQPTVSTPVSWDEIKKAAETANPQLLHFTAPEVLDRVKTYSDLFAPVLSIKQQLPNLPLFD